MGCGWQLISACSTSASARGEPIHFLYPPLLSFSIIFVCFFLNSFRDYRERGLGIRVGTNARKGTRWIATCYLFIKKFN